MELGTELKYYCNATDSIITGNVIGIGTQPHFMGSYNIKVTKCSVNFYRKRMIGETHRVWDWMLEEYKEMFE